VSVRVLIADDQRLVRAGLAMILDGEPGIEVIGEAVDGSEAIDTARRIAPDVVLMDIRMPKIDGLEATRAIRSRPDSPRVLMLTTFDLDEYVFEALRAGASGFLLKDAPDERLIAAIHVAADGGALFDPAATRRLIETFVSGIPGGTSPVDMLSALTARETEVLHLIAKGMTNAEIAEQLIISPATAKTHVAAILAKLGLRDRIQAVIAAYESGLVRRGN
jgi:DNA-binding NarL/FixJ family response regulator